MEDKEVLRYVIDGFKLIPAKHGFANSYVTKTGKASDTLSKAINARIKKNFPNSNIRTRVERNYHTLNFYRHMQESFADKATNLLLELLEARSSSPTRIARDKLVKSDSRLRRASTSNRIFSNTVSYTHLTLPTKRIV